VLREAAGALHTLPDLEEEQFAVVDEEECIGLCISIFMPTHRLGREVQQDPIRLKNLLGEAEEHSLASDLRDANLGGANAKEPNRSELISSGLICVEPNNSGPT
jgi:hypothetical protein